MPVSTTPNSVITLAGLAAAALAGQSGPVMNLTKFRIGSASMAQGCIPTETDVDVTDFVYEGDNTQMRYSIVDDSTVHFVIYLSDQVGDFTIGNFAIFLADGTMLAKVSLPAQVPKSRTIAPTVLGNHRLLVVEICLSNVANIVNFALLDTTDCTLPEVPTEADLPAPNVAIYNVYMVRNHTLLGEPAAAFRLNGAWKYRSFRTLAGAGETIMTIAQSLFDAPAVVDKFVYLDTIAPVYKRLEGTKQPVGVRSSAAQITTMGPYKVPVANQPLTPGAIYYANSIGDLTPTESATTFPVGVAMNTDTLWVDLAGTITGKGGDGGASAINIVHFISPLSRISISGVGTSWQTAYTCPSNTSIVRAVINSIRAVNRGSGFIRGYMRILDASNGNAACMLSPGHLMSIGDNMDFILRKIVLQPNDVLQFLSTSPGSLDISVSYSEVQDGNLFKVAKPGLTTTPVTLYTVPANKVMVAESLIAASMHPVVPGSFFLNAGSDTLAYAQTVPVGGSMELFEYEQSFAAGTVLTTRAGSLGQVDCYLSGRLSG